MLTDAAFNVEMWAMNKASRAFTQNEVAPILWRLPTGTLLAVRLIGVVNAEQTEKGKTARNDGILSVSTVSHLYQRIENIDQLGETYVNNLTRFWVDNEELRGVGFRVLSVVDVEQAKACILRSAKERKKAG